MCGVGEDKGSKTSSQPLRSLTTALSQVWGWELKQGFSNLRRIRVPWRTDK